MKVSVNWIREFMNLSLPPTDQLVAAIGAQLGGVDEVIDLAARYRGVVIVRVVSVKPHENSDHLNICMIDDGKVTENVERQSDGLVQVVCGAPNVREGMLVAWLPPGSVVPSSHDESEPFVLSARPLRGVVSNGMLASAKELAIGDSHEGILDLDGEHHPGDSFATAFDLNDTIIDIENKMFTHRPDCFGQLGIAREVCGILNRPFTSPSWYTSTSSMITTRGDETMRINLSNEIPELVPRYMLIALDGITIMPSPVWLQTHLTRLGVRPINNIVDVTNYMMLLTGQPLHAFDYDKVAVDGEATIVVRNPHIDEPLTLLDGKTIQPRPDAILICDGQKPIGLGGMMGGQNSEIDETTTRILIECANFDMYNIRRSSMEHGIFSDAVTRFTKGQSEWQCPTVLRQAVRMIQDLCEQARPVGKVIDQHQPRREFQPVTVDVSFINKRLGSKLSSEEIQRLLDDVEFETRENDKSLTVGVPFWRTDIELREDLVEEVGRLYGYDKLPLALPDRDLTPAAQDPSLSLKSALRTTLATAGANEVLTYSFVHGNLFQKVGQDQRQAFKLTNALSPDLQYFRLSLTPSLLEKVHLNIKAGYDQFALFELGKPHGISETDEQGIPTSFDRLSLVVAANPKAAKQYAGAPFYQAMQYAESVLTRFTQRDALRLEPLQGTNLDEQPLLGQMVAPFEPNRTALVYHEKQVIGVVGEYRAAVRNALKLPDFCGGFELLLSGLNHQQDASYQPLARFPKVMQDITLQVPSDRPYGTVFQSIQEALAKHQPSETTSTVQPIDIYQFEDSEYKNLTFRVSVVNHQRTLRATAVNELLDTVSKTVDAERV